MPIRLPTTTVDLWLKRVAVDSLSELGREALDTAFPGFELSEDYLVPDEFEGHRLHIRRERRFGGDANLSSKRYFTVCNDSSGNDHGTLVYELYAYYVPERVGPVKLGEIDLRRDEFRRHLEAHGVDAFPEEPLALEVSFLPHSAKPHPFASKHGQTSAVPYHVLLPTSLHRERIDGS